MADITFGDAPDSVAGIQSRYMEQVQKRRLYGGLTLLIFVVLMVSGFNIADARNAGGFWEGLHQIGDYPADGIVQYLLHYFPGLFEGHLFGLFFSHNPHGD